MRSWPLTRPSPFKSPGFRLSNRWSQYLVHSQLGRFRLAATLAGREVSVEEVLRAFEQEVGTHLSGVDQSPLPGLAVHEHDGPRMMALPRPWPQSCFSELGELLGPQWYLTRRGERVPGADLREQTTWLHLTVGAQRPWIGPLELNCEA